MSSIIRRISCYEVIVPALPGVISSAGIDKPLHKLPVGVKSGWSVQFDKLPKLLVRIELSGGIIGWGELYRDHDWRQVANICELLIGMDLGNFVLKKLPFGYCREYDGFECAVYDAYAKLHQMRVVDLLGGPLRDKIKVGAWSSHRSLEEIGEWSAQYEQQGYDCIKFKTDLSDDVVGWAAEIQRYAPDIKIILDPNERWNGFETRLRIIQLSEVGNILCLEDPIPRWQLQEYAILRKNSSIPIALHVSLPYILHGQRVHDAINALEHHAVDGFNFNGGAARFIQLANIADAAEKPYWHGSEIDLGILEAMYIHTSAAGQYCIWPGDIFGTMIREHDLLKQSLKIDPPYAYLPEGYGLGVNPDMDAIQHYLINHKEYN